VGSDAPDSVSVAFVYSDEWAAQAVDQDRQRQAQRPSIVAAIQQPPEAPVDLTLELPM
jgi:hypothetical protein